MTPPSELVAEAVLRRAANADRPAQQEVVNAIYDLVRRTLYRSLLGRAQDLDDLQQLVLIRVLTSLPSFRFESSFKTWVTAICINVVRDRLRSAKRESRLERGVEEDAMPPGTDPDPQRHLETHEALNRCARIIEALPINQRTAFVLQAVHGYSVAEIAAMMNSAHSTTRLRLYYARRACRKAFAAASRAPITMPARSVPGGNDGTA